MASVISTIEEMPPVVAGWMAVALMMAQLVIVALRYVFAIGWPWALDLLVFLFVLGGLLPGIAVILKNLSIRVDVFYDGWSHQRQCLMDRIALLLLLCPTFGYAAWSMSGSVLRSWQVFESSPTIGGLPGYFLLKTLLLLYFVGISLVAFRLALRADPYGRREQE